MWVILVVVLQLPQLEVLQRPAGAVVAQDLEADVPFFEETRTDFDQRPAE